MEIGKNIQKIRSDNKLTQDDLAEKYFVTRQTISNWENGKSYPDLETLVKISDDFKISLDKLLKEDYEMVKSISKTQKEYRKVNTYKLILKFVLVIAVGLVLFPLVEYIGCKINHCKFVYLFQYILYPFIAGFVILVLNMLPMKDKIKKIGLICVIAVLFVVSIVFYFKKDFRFEVALSDYDLVEDININGLLTNNSNFLQLEEPRTLMLYKADEGVYHLIIKDCRNITRTIVFVDDNDNYYRLKYTISKDGKISLERTE